MVMTDTLNCRIQYVDDSDPFATTSCSHLEPSRPVMYNFSLNQPIGEQLPEVIRSLRAPHKVATLSCTFSILICLQIYLL